MSSFQTKIVSELLKLGNLDTPDSKHNVGRLIGEAYLWDEVAKYARAKSDQAWSALEEQGHVLRPEHPGLHDLCRSPSFTVTAKVTEPIKRFKQDELANLLNKSKYRVPKPTTIEYCEKAKVPTKPAVTYVIAERQ